jgi:hypothetical protein
MTTEDWMGEVRCYNCGVIVGKVGAWKELRGDFERDAAEWIA